MTKPKPKLSLSDQVATIFGRFSTYGTGETIVIRCHVCPGTPEVVEVESGMGLDELVLTCLAHWRLQHRAPVKAQAG